MESPRAWKRRALGVTTGLAAFVALALIPSELHRIEGFGDRPALMAGIAVLMATWWFSEAVPIALTACVPLLLYPALGVFGLPPAESLLPTVEPFFDAYIFLFLGGMLLGASMEHWNLHRRVALHIMHLIGTAPSRLLLGMLVATAAISLWISNTATAVMMMPIGLALVSQLEKSQKTKVEGFDTALMLAVAYGASVGGIGTKIGTPTNSVYAGFLSEKLGYEISFLQFMALGLPFVVLFIPVLWFVLGRLGRDASQSSTEGRQVLDEELRALGPMSREEKKVAVIFVMAALLWIFADPLRSQVEPIVATLIDGFKLRSKHVEAAIALLAALALFSTRVATRQTVKAVPYSALILLGGSFALAAGIESSGLSQWLSRQLIGVGSLPLIWQLLAASTATIVLSAVASNTAAINVMLNVLPSSLPVYAAAAISSSCDFALPAGTPPNAIVFGSGRVRLPVMMRTGVVLDVVAAIFVTVYVAVYARHLL